MVRLMVRRRENRAEAEGSRLKEKFDFIFKSKQ